MMYKLSTRVLLSLLTVILFTGILLSSCNNSKISKQKYSVWMAQSEMKRCPEAWMIDFSKKLKWNYTHGLVGKSFLDLYDSYGDSTYYNYVKAYADTMIFDDGTIWGYKPTDYNIDRINSGKILFRILKKEHNGKYKIALSNLREQLTTHPRTAEGGFWHKKVYPCQMWLDGLYMGAPFYAEYAAYDNDTAAFTDVAKQFILVKKHLYDTKTGLYFHGWDECKKQAWADSITGQSPHIWGRAVGWYFMALVDALDFIPENHPDRPEIIQIFSDLATALTNVQDSATGVWYQVLDQANREGNYLESSCSTMFAYGLYKGIRKGYLKPSFLDSANKAYHGILNTFIKENNDKTISITNCCAVAGLGGKPYRDGSYNYYISEPVRDNDPKSVGPFIMASLEYELLNQ